MKNITSIVSKNKDLFNAMVEKYEAQAQELELTLDVDGRFHAPKGGVEFEGFFYIGGQYVPFEHNAPQGSQSKVMIEFNDFNALKDIMNGYATLSHGKTWERDNKTFTYLYFSGYRSFEVVQAIESYYADKAKSLVTGTAPMGKTQVVAKVLNLRVEMGAYGPQTKMLVEFEDGAKAFGTAPKGDYAVGDRITFKAEFERKDQAFSFFKRPSLVAGA